MTLATILLDLEEQEELRYREALIAAGGDEAKLAELQANKKPTSSVGHTIEVELLMKLTDWMQTLNSTLIGVNLPKGKRPPKVRPHPRPVSALAVLRREREDNSVNEMLADLGIPAR